MHRTVTCITADRINKHVLTRPQINKIKYKDLIFKSKYYSNSYFSQWFCMIDICLFNEGSDHLHHTVVSHSPLGSDLRWHICSSLPLSSPTLGAWRHILTFSLPHWGLKEARVVSPEDLQAQNWCCNILFSDFITAWRLPIEFDW